MNIYPHARTRTRQAPRSPGSPAVMDLHNGKARIYRGDCLAILRSLADGAADHAFLDPPYSSGGMFRGDRAMNTTEKYVNSGTLIDRVDFNGDNRDQRGWAIWSTMWLTELTRVVKPGGLICMFTDWRQLPTATDMMQAGGWVWRGIIPWNKTEAARPQRGRFRNQCEYVLWGSNGELAEKTSKAMPGFFTYVVRQADKFHITGKPTSLMTDLMEATAPGDVIIDPFMGSGTTLVAAIEAGRRAIGIDSSRHYFQVAADRIRTAQPPLMVMQGSLL